MATFLVEHYWPGVTPDGFGAAAENLARSADDLALDGAQVRFLDSTFVPDDETGFCVFEAASESEVVAAYERAGIPVERVMTAVRAELRGMG